MRYSGPAAASHIQGGYWADIIGTGSGSPPFIVSDRVINALSDLGTTGFTANPVTISSVLDPRLSNSRQPSYFYLSIHGRVSIDWKKSRLAEPCLSCGAPLNPQIGTPEKVFPIESSWDSTDIFEGVPWGGPYCTLRILELARKQHWTNFRFYAIGEEQNVMSGWDGIDYLGKQWPPLWYGNSPSVGKTPDEWLEEFFSISGQSDVDYLRYQVALRALNDLGELAGDKRLF